MLSIYIARSRHLDFLSRDRGRHNTILVTTSWTVLHLTFLKNYTSDINYSLTVSNLQFISYGQYLKDCLDCWTLSAFFAWKMQNLVSEI